MAFWSGETILKNSRALDIIQPLDAKRIDSAAYTLRMGGEYFVTPDFQPQRTFLLTHKSPFSGHRAKRIRRSVPNPAGPIRLFAYRRIPTYPQECPRVYLAEDAPKMERVGECLGVPR